MNKNMSSKSGYGEKISYALQILPIIIPTIIAAVGSVAVLFLVLDKFRLEYILPIGTIISVPAVYIIYKNGSVKRPGTKREQTLCTLSVLVGLLAWTGINAHYASQHVFTNRDPAIYAVAGEWLTKHDNLKIPIPKEFGKVQGVIEGSPGFGVDVKHNPPRIFAQGQHMLPALLGIAGRFIGDYLLKLNVLFGAIALLSIYSFASLLARPRWALVITAALAASMPFLYFSRDTYTEPLAAALIFCALSLLWMAQKNKKSALWFLTGLIIGVGAIVRIDAYLTIAAMLAFLSIWLAAAPKNEHRPRIVQATLLSLGMLVTSILGWVDATSLAWPYYRDLSKNFHSEFKLIVLVIILGLAIVTLGWKTKILKSLDKNTLKWRSEVVAIAVLTTALVLASRPFYEWYHLHLQTASSISPHHSYTELTTYWIQWYLGPLLTFLGLGGLAYSAALAVKNRSQILLPSLIVIFSTSLIYVVNPNISPDQIWAIRRFLPIILPGLAVFAAVSLDWVSQHFFEKVKFGSIFAIITSLAILVGVLFTSAPLILLRDSAQLAPVESSCSVLPKKASVLFVGTARLLMLQPIHAYCSIPANAYQIGDNGTPSKQTLIKVASNVRKSGRIPIIGLFGKDVNLLSEATNSNYKLTKAADFTYRQLEQSFFHPPQRIVDTSENINYGIITSRGEIKPLY